MSVARSPRKNEQSDKRSYSDIPDPLSPDDVDDLPVVVTRRRLARLALVSSETTARFQREGLSFDPMAWMLAPLSLFAGRDALEAALHLDDCRRAILVHGLGLPLDADPAAVDDLCRDDDDAVPSPAARAMPGADR